MSDYTKMSYEKFDGGGVILSDDSVIICDGDPETLLAPNEHIMQEIVKRWNAHDELLEALEGVTRTCSALVTIAGDEPEEFMSIAVAQAAIRKGMGEKT